MSGRSIDIALTRAEAGDSTETVYENVCTLATEPELCFNYATTAQLKDWNFTEGCFSCLLLNKKDIIIQVITTYQHREGAACAYNADVDYLKNNNYGRTIKARTFGESSVLFKKKQSDGVTYNLLFLKNTVFAAVSAKYRVDGTENIDHFTSLVEKIHAKIN